MIREQHGVAVADNPLADELSSSEFTRKQEGIAEAETSSPDYELPSSEFTRQQEGIAEAETSLAKEVPLRPRMRVAVPDTDTKPTPTPPAAQLSPPSMIKENKGIALSYTPLEDQLPSTMTKVIARPGSSLILIYRLANKLLAVGLDQKEEKPTVAE